LLKRKKRPPDNLLSLKYTSPLTVVFTVGEFFRIAAG
jgi:hypothetical protein